MAALAVALLVTAAGSSLAQPEPRTPSPEPRRAPIRLDLGRFTAVCYPADEPLARALLAEAARTDTFPGLPRSTQRVLVAVAPDFRTFREWVGPAAPEWGAAVAFPESRRIVLQGRAAGSDAGDPRETLRHELAHLALHEYLGDLPPRWFDEGYASFAAREWKREDLLATNVAIAFRGMPTLDELEEQFSGGATAAQSAYALAYRAVADLAMLDPDSGLARLFPRWKATRSLDRALRAGYGTTLDAFELDWRRRTRRRYGALALFSDFTIAGLVVLLLVAPLYLVRRRRQRDRMAALVAADVAAEAEAARRQSVLDALLGGSADPPKAAESGEGPHGTGPERVPQGPDK